MTNIPISFEYEQQHYTGHFKQVSGSGSTASFHLMIDNFYQGQLVHTTEHGWQFTSNKNKFVTLSQFFGDYITAWMQ